MNLKIIKRTIEISRPIFWPSTFFGFILGIILSRHQITLDSLLFALLWTFPYSLWLSTVNDLADVASDKINSFKGNLSGATMKKSETVLFNRLKWASLVCLIMPIFLTFNYIFWISSLLAIFIPYAYSAYPFRLKEKPLFDSFSNGAVATSIFTSGYVFNKDFIVGEMFIQICLALFFGVSAIHIIGALRDYTPDTLSHTKTIAVVWGQKASALLASFLFLLVYLVIQNFPVEFRLVSLAGIVSALYLAFKLSETMSFRIAFALMIGFFLAVSYSILFHSWDLYL